MKIVNLITCATFCPAVVNIRILGFALSPESPINFRWDQQMEHHEWDINLDLYLVPTQYDRHAIRVEYFTKYVQLPFTQIL